METDILEVKPEAKGVLPCRSGVLQLWQARKLSQRLPLVVCAVVAVIGDDSDLDDADLDPQLVFAATMVPPYDPAAQYEWVAVVRSYQVAARGNNYK